MFQRLFSFLLLLVLPLAVWSQQAPGVCGTVESEEFMDNLRTLKERIADGLLVNRDGAVTYVPVKFHISTKSDGTKGVSEGLVLDALCHLNESYADQNIQFYSYQGFNYINNDVVWNDPGDSPLILQGNKVAKAMNVFIGENPVGSSGLGTTLGYYTGGGNDWIVMRRTEINGFSSTLAHEVGHYFSLAHPFRGWDCTFWQEAIHGNPVSFLQSPCDPTIPIEFSNGDNCDVAADLLCDTPADYNFGFGDPGNDCVYNVNCLDPNGDPMDPQENNFMGYFNNCAQYFFTPQQKDVVAARLDQRKPALATNYTPPATTINGTTSLIQPADGSVTDAYNNVAFEWEPVDGANQYLLEIDLSTTFNILPTRMIVWGTFKVVQGLQPNKKYYWRVKPFNGYQTCAPTSQRWDFTTGTATGTVEPSYVTNWTVRPNPVAAGQSLQLDMYTNESFEATISLRTLSGQTLQTLQTAFAAGNSTLEIPTLGLANGLYFLTVQSPEGILNKRVVIAQ